MKEKYHEHILGTEESLKVVKGIFYQEVEVKICGLSLLSNGASNTVNKN